jgi:hypothetical protein
MGGGGCCGDAGFGGLLFAATVGGFVLMLMDVSSRLIEGESD